MVLTRTRVLNITALVVLGLCLAFGLTYSEEQVGAIALLVWGVLNLFTEGGIKERILSRTVIVNGMTALLGLVGSLGLFHFTNAQAAQVTLLVVMVLNLFTEGGIVDPAKSKASDAALLVIGALTLALFTTGCASTVAKLPAPESIATAAQANTALVKAQAIRVGLRDGLAEAHVSGLASAAAVATFDRYDSIFTDTYRAARTAIDAGMLESFRESYRKLLDAVAGLRFAGGGR